MGLEAAVTWKWFDAAAVYGDAAPRYWVVDGVVPRKSPLCRAGAMSPDRSRRGGV